MTHFAACVGCAKKTTCDHLANMKRHLALLHISSVKHRCPMRDPEYKPGDQVTVFTDADFNAPTGPDGEGRVRAWFKGTVINEHRHERTKIVVFVRPGTLAEGGDSVEFSTSGRGFVKIPRSRIKKFDAPPIEITECGMCSSVLPLQGCSWDFAGLGNPVRPCQAKAKSEEKSD